MLRKFEWELKHVRKEFKVKDDIRIDCVMGLKKQKIGTSKYLLRNLLKSRELQVFNIVKYQEVILFAIKMFFHLKSMLLF